MGLQVPDVGPAHPGACALATSVRKWVGPRALCPAMEPPTYVLGEGGGSPVWPPPGSPQSPPASYYTRGKRSKTEDAPAPSHLGVEAFLALSSSDLCPDVTCLVPAGTWNKGCSPERSSDPAEQHCASDSFLEPSNVLPALPPVFRSHSRLREGVPRPLP